MSRSETTKNNPTPVADGDKRRKKYFSSWIAVLAVIATITSIGGFVIGLGNYLREPLSQQISPPSPSTSFVQPLPTVILSRPQNATILIMAPREGESVSGRIVIKGSSVVKAPGVLERLIVFVVVQEIRKSRYYPQNVLHLTTGKPFTTDVSLDNIASGQMFRIMLVSASSKAAVVLQNYLIAAQRAGSYPGIDRLPAEVKVLAEVGVTRTSR